MKIKEEIEKYCKLNFINNIDDFINDCLTIGFNVKKYGYSPQNNFNIEQNVISKIKNNNEDKIPIVDKTIKEEENIDKSNIDKKAVKVNKKVKIIKK